MTVMPGESARETTQLTLAFERDLRELRGGDVGHLRARRRGGSAVIVGLPSTVSIVSRASVSMAVAVKPALLSVKDSAIVKQPACAAAMSSSGFVPLPSPKRALNEYGRVAQGAALHRKRSAAFLRRALPAGGCLALHGRFPQVAEYAF